MTRVPRIIDTQNVSNSVPVGYAIEPCSAIPEHRTERRVFSPIVEIWNRIYTDYSAYTEHFVSI